MTLVDDVQRFSGDSKFDAVLCLGNSFAHLPDFEGDLQNQRKALRNFRALIKPGGILVIDHRNYDDILTCGQVPAKNIYYNVSHFHLICNSVNFSLTQSIKLYYSAPRS